MINIMQNIDKMVNCNYNSALLTSTTTSTTVITKRYAVRQVSHTSIISKSQGYKHLSLAKARQQSRIRFFLIAAITYILSPIDLVPEAIFGIFGILDDLIFLLMCLFCIAIIVLYPIFREIRYTIFNKLQYLASHKTY